MKKILGFIVLSVSLITLAACNTNSLKVFSYGDYIDPQILRDFEREFGMPVKLITFDSNERALTKMKLEKFDVVIPSDYAVEQLIKEDMIQPIDWTKITNLNKETSFPLELKSLLNDLKKDENPLDLLEYMVPYFWGNMGIVYNTEKVSLADLEQYEWDIFNQTNLPAVVYDSSRDGFMMALKHLGYSMNSNVTTELTEAEAYLTTIAKKNNVVFLTDEILDDMLTTKYDLVQAYSGDAVYLMDENDKLNFYVPEVGTNVWVDGMVIPKNAEKVDLAHEFINFISSYEKALANTEYVFYQSPRKDVYEYMIGSDDYAHLREAYQVKRNPNDEIFRYVPEVKKFVDDAWLKIITN